MLVSKDWQNYKIIKCSKGKKLEIWNDIILLRPDPVVTWDMGKFDLENINAVYHRSNKGGGYWENLKDTPASWIVTYKDLKFNIKQMGFKHTGLFPEQAINWDYIMAKISTRKDAKVLNLFAYTGAASVAALKSGASVVHVDSSKGMVDWAKENVKSNHLENETIRFLVDDVKKFVKRELRRGNKYDIILMDPPSFGRGSNGEVWNIEESLYKLIKLCLDVLSDKPLFFLINSYTTGLSPLVLENILMLTVNKKHKGKISSGEVGLPMTNSKLVLPCGIYGLWEDE